MSTNATGEPATAVISAKGLSRKERIGLHIHRGLDKKLSAVGIWAFRRTKGGIAKPWNADVLVLTTVGRRSGRERNVILQFFPDGDAMIVAAANGGEDANPAWYANLKAGPAARVEVVGQTIEVRAEDLPDEEAAVWWTRIEERDHNYERYTRATNRRIPVLRLVPTTKAS
ncbi:MAG TPA: nitroreductase/quinone reductase family protein [Candidatus Limnocylindrales bacterium]